MEQPQIVELRTGAWKYDQKLKLKFPNRWKIIPVGIENLRRLSDSELQSCLSNPIGQKKIEDIVKDKKKITIVIDDLTRPTPLGRILPLLAQKLKAGGAITENIDVIIAGGTHPRMSREDIERKVEGHTGLFGNIITHDPENNLKYLGKTERATPIYVNKNIIDSDVIIGIGCIYPHPAAGFSGGSKIIVPGVCGSETTRYIHDYIKGGKRGNISSDSEIRREMDVIASRAGLDFVINAVLNQDRDIAGLFTGDKKLAYEEGAKYAKGLYTFNKVDDADVVIVDAYPFDMDFQFAHDRGLWLFNGLKKNVSKVIISSCYKGLGSHELYPVNKPLGARIKRRIKNLKIKDFRFLFEKIFIIKRIIKLGRQTIIVFSEYLKEEELKTAFKRSVLHNNWDNLIHQVSSEHGNTTLKVALYKCAPFIIIENT